MIEKIAYEHMDSEHPQAIVWSIKQIKPFLILVNMKWHVEYCKWALDKLEKRAIFIFSDKDYWNFGGISYKKQHITRIKRKPAKQYAEPQKTVQFSFMHWGAICFDTKIKASITIFDVETTYEKKASKKSLKLENKQFQKKIKKM